MKASELIKELTDAVEKYGDLKVTHSTYGEDVVQRVEVYDENGSWSNVDGGKGNAYEIHLH